MWKLTSKTGRIHYLLPEKEKHIVGRSNADLILKDDSSISRTHAYLLPADNHVKLIDVGSKYGTFYNENIDHKIAMDQNVPVELKNGERVCFGIIQNEWILSKMKLVTLTSTLNTDQKFQLKEILKSLNGEIIESFAPNCTHLTMRGITVTPKLLYALIERIPIVNCQYWRDYLIELRNGNLPPNPENYLPEIAEEFLKFSKHLLKPNEGRKTLFAGKTFIFIGKKHYDTYLSIIPQAGGNIKTLNQGVPKSMLTQKNVIVIQYMPTTQSQSSQTIDDIAEYLKSKLIRMIPDYEIGLALVNCSIEKYCNPKFNVMRDVCSPTKLTENQQLETIAAETPINKETNSIDNAVCIEIPESNIYDPQTEKTAAMNENEIEFIENTDEFVVHSNENNIGIITDFETPIEENIAGQLNNNENKRKRNYNINENNEKKNYKKICPDKTKEISKNITKMTVNIEGFFNSSQIIKSTQKEIVPENINNKSSEKDNSEGKKRGRFALITSDDDDDDDLFDFGKSLKKSKSNCDKDSSSNSENIGNVNTEKSNRNTRSNTTISNNATKSALNPHRIQIVVKQSEPERIQQVVEKNITITPGEWLSKSLIKLEIKDDVERNQTNTSVNDSIRFDWIKSIKGGFEVRPKEMNLILQTRRNTSLEESNNSSLQTDKGKNFKAFVKKRNFIPQKEIVTTVPFQIHGFSF